MSGGRFDHTQYQISTIADTIELVIERNNKPIDPKDKESWDTREVYSSYSDDTIALFKLGVKLLRMGFIYAHHIDQVLSSDTDEDGFAKRLTRELKNLSRNEKANSGRLDT